MLDFKHLKFAADFEVVISCCRHTLKNMPSVTRTVCIFKPPMLRGWQLLHYCKKQALFQVPPRNRLQGF